jgi:hypothetical protein
MNLPELLMRAQRRETTTASELAEVIRLIESREDGDIYSLLEILGRSGSSRYKRLMEPYLHNVHDSQLSALALKALCNWWDLFGEYRSDVIAFLNGVSLDSEDYVKLQAISIAGEHLRKSDDKELLKIIYQIFSNEMGRPLVRSAAYFALCRSEGLEWRDIPPASRILDFTKEVDHGVVADVERKLRAALS